ncbi:MAG: hypothetical protein WKF84_19240 [Pyrinomonadaceae bacterium]
MASALRDTGIYAVSDEIYRELYYTPERLAQSPSFIRARLSSAVFRNL